MGFAAQGRVGDTNPCTNGTYKYNDKAPTAFGLGKADALFGYSERIHYAVKVKADPARMFVLSAPIGDGSDPLWFVDALVMRTYPGPEEELTDDQKTEYYEGIEKKKRAGEAFVAYLNDPRTFAWIHMSEDLGLDAARRYLIPGTRSAFLDLAIADDPIMKQIRPLISQGTFFPRFRLLGMRRGMANEVEAAWTISSAGK